MLGVEHARQLLQIPKILINLFIHLPIYVSCDCTRACVLRVFVKSYELKSD